MEGKEDQAVCMNSNLNANLIVDAFLQENRCLLFTYYLLLLVLFIGVIVSATIAFTQSLDILREPLLKSLSQYRASTTDPESVEVTGTWDELQKKVGQL